MNKRVFAFIAWPVGVLFVTVSTLFAIGLFYSDYADCVPTTESANTVLGWLVVLIGLAVTVTIGFSLRKVIPTWWLIIGMVGQLSVCTLFLLPANCGTG